MVLTLPLLEGLDGSQKMSKSLNNAVSFNDSPKEIYGKIMKISDDLLVRWWSLFSHAEVNLKDILKQKQINPKTKKEELAWTLICSLYGEEKADLAQEEFSRVFSDKGLPDQIPEKLIKPSKGLWLCQLIKDVGLCSSTSSARRGVLSGAVRKDGTQCLDPQAKWDLKSGEEFLLSFGKRHFIKVKVK